MPNIRMCIAAFLVIPHFLPPIGQIIRIHSTKVLSDTL